MTQPVARIVGLEDLQRTLRRADPNMARELGRANKDVASIYVSEAQPKMPRARAASRDLPRGISARARQKDITLAVRSTKTRPSVAAVLGANTHPVFGRRFPVSRLSRPVWERHLGDGWRPEQLYGIGEVFEGVPDKVADQWIDAFERAAEGWLRG